MNGPGAMNTLVDLLQLRAAENASVGYTFLVDGEAQEVTASYSALDRWARAIAVRLQAQGATGERVLILYPPGLDYIAAFFGCLYAGAVAVPAYPPDPTRLARTLPRLQAIVHDAQAKFALTTAQILSFGPMLFGQAPELAALSWLSTDELASGDGASGWTAPTITSDALAFLQYTSGSTGDPKGVMLTHQNLISNERMIAAGFGTTTNDVVGGWLPLYHDMGLIGNLLQPLYLGVRCVLMSPISFLQRPQRWLQMISRYRVSASGGPNFAYDLCVRKTAPEERARLDLSSWTVAFTGAEPVRSESLDRFAEAFAPSGFKPTAYYPCYGLAEATLLVSGGARTDAPRLIRISASELERNRVVTAADGRIFVGCGREILDEKIAIVDPETRTLVADDRVGEIWVSGPHIARGYWNRPELSEETFRAHLAGGEGRFLRTGDLGFFLHGQLYVTGRIKDLIIVRGRNHYPQDIELSVERRVPGVRPGCSAAFSIDVDGDERLAIVCELDPKYASDSDNVIASIRQVISEDHELQAHAVCLVKSGTIPKTSSGKIQRRSCKDAFSHERLDALRVWRGSSDVVPHEAPVAASRAEATPFDSEVATAVAKLLGVERSSIDLDTPLSAHGIDSLAAVELAEALQRAFGVEIPMQDLLAGPSIREVARMLGERKPATAPEPARGRDEHELSHGQRALWLIHQLAPQSPAYNVSIAARVHNVVDVEALRRSCQRIVLRHAALRTTFPAHEGRPVARLAAYKDIDFATIDAGNSDQSSLEQRLTAEANRPFDLANGPLLRVRVFQGPARTILLVSAHHIVVDMWSLVLFGDELGQLYTEETGGADAKLTDLRVQYADHARGEQALVADGNSKQARYWKEHLAGELPLLSMPLDHPRPPLQTYRGSTLRFTVPRETVEHLNAIGKQRGTTLYMTLLAAYYVLLHRHTGQTDIIVGSPVRGRSRPDLRHVIGYFINMMPLRAEIAPEQAFGELLARVRKLALAGFASSDYPFVAMVDQLQPSRDPRYSPIFQTSFTFQKGQGEHGTGMTALALGEPGVVSDIGGLSLEAVPLDLGIAQFDLALAMGETGSGISATLDYNSDLFDRATIERFAAHYLVLLESIAADPSTPVGRLGILTEVERRELVVEWNDTKREYPTSVRVEELVSAWAVRTPDAIAVEHRGATLTYRELDLRANRLAHRLRAHGVSTNGIVAVHLERSLDTVVAWLASWKAGAAYLPIAPDLGSERIAYMLDDAGALVVITDTVLGGRLAGSARMLCLDAEAGALARDPDSAPDVGELDAAATAYVIYTSGSTGNPKGSLVEHPSLVNLVSWHNRTFALAAGDRTSQLAGLSFDASVWETWPTLVAGATLCLIDDGLRTDPAGVRDWLVAQRIAVTFVPTSLAEPMLALDWPSSQLRTLLTGGDRLGRRPPKNLPFALVNNYGPTECTVLCLSGPVTVERSNGDRAIDLGRPIDNAQVYVLGPLAEPTPIGVHGEISIAGVGVGAGYLRRPELTAEKFVPNPFGAGRLYRTGDLGRWLPNGTIEFVGRVDQQVKIRGFRIELGEIEAVLGSHPSVHAAVVLARQDRLGDKRMVAYLVGRDGAPDLSVLRADIKGRLPDYMIPSAFVVLDQLPLTSNGKIDRKALPEPDWAGDGGHEYVAPRTPTEELLATMWAQLLHLDRVGVETSFFELGGHSLLATQVVSRVREAFGIELPLRRLFEAPTIAALAREVDRLPAAPLAPIGRAPRDRNLELSFAQQRLWFFDKLAPDNAAYNIPGGVRLRGKLDVGALTRSLNAIVARHESLRTTFEESGDQPFQRFTSSVVIDLPVIEATSRAHAETLARAVAERPFDLRRGPLIRAQLLRLDAEEYWFILSMHHIASDGWSMGVFIDELTTLYNGGQLAPLALQYADYAHWQRGWLAGSVLDEQIAYWKAQLDGLQSLVELPTDRPRPPVMTYRGTKYTFEISPLVATSLEALSHEHSVTLFMTLLAAFEVLLYRYSHQEDFAVGSPIANRNRAETEALIGFFVNTLVLRANASGNPTFVELLGRVREVALGAYAHQDIPFERLVEELQPERTLSYSPLFQVMFALDDAPAMRPLNGLEYQLFPLDSGRTQFDLSLGLERRSDKLIGTVEYSTDLFDAATIARMMGHYERVLETIVADPHQRIAALPILTKREEHQILVEWNDNALAYPRNTCVHALIEAHVDRSPDSLAVASHDAELTYGELEHRANQLAQHLISMGVGPEVRVGICIDRSVDMIVGLIGIMKAGGAYVPLDPNYPRERLELMCEDSALAVVVTQERWLAVLPAKGIPIVCIDRDKALIAKRSAERPRVGVQAENLAYVIYSSGSTGRPNGVLIEHRAITNLVIGFGAVGGVSSADRVLQFSTINFDGSVDEIFTTLAHGAALLLRGADAPGPRELLALPHLKGATTLPLTTAYWHQLGTAMDRGEVVLPASVSRLNIGGERALPEQVRQWELLAPGATFYNVYGPTETTAIATVWRQNASELLPGRQVPIGKPLPNVKAYVLDGNLAPVPIGVAGELYIAGDGVARGYQNRAQRTAERFLRNPFGEDRMYRTGDLVCWLANGNLEYLGRSDNQVKVRGFRIELGEIESVLADHPSIRDVVVLAREDVPGDKRLVAYLIGRDGAPDPKTIRAYLRSKLPEYMVPAAFVVLDEFRLTAGHKVDRRALPVPEPARPEDTFVAPRTATEVVVAGIWERVLGIKSVGIDDNFFALGGHSLLATQVTSRVRESLEFELPLQLLFNAPTVRELAKEIDAGRRPAAPPIVPIPRSSEIELSFAQQRVWFFDQLEPGNTSYNLPGAVRFVGKLDVSALVRSLRAIVARHESLRTTFATRDGRPVQLIAPELTLDVPVIDVGSVDDARALALIDAQQPFDLTVGPLVRARLLRLAPEEHWLLISMHHIVSDGWSMSVLMGELRALYAGDELSPLAIQYADFAAWQRRWLAGDVLRQQVDYWKRQLAGSPAVLELPTDRPRPPVFSYRGATITFSLPSGLSKQLDALGKQHSATLFMTLLAAFHTLLHRYSGQSDINVGSLVANRNRAEIESLIGFFVNTLVLRADLSTNPTFDELLAQVREVALGAYAHQDVPFEQLVAELQPERSLAYAPLFQAMLVLQNTPPVESLPGVAQTYVDLMDATAKFDLSFLMDEGSDGLSGMVQYSTDLFDASTIERLIASFKMLLEGIVADPRRRIGELPIVSEPDVHRIVHEWNSTAREWTRDRCMHELFEAQVARAPGALAVLGAGGELSYAALDARANQLARTLREAGVGPEVTVAVCLDRSIEMIVTVLAIGKAGGAYVPIDPSWPRIRVEQILGPLGARGLVTQEVHLPAMRELQQALPELRALVCVDATGDLPGVVTATQIAQQSRERMSRLGGPDDLAYIIFTSGSTGVPKGVVVRHRSAVNVIEWVNRTFGIGPDDRLLFVTALSFDLSVYDIFGVLAAGGSIRVAASAEIRDPERLVAVLLNESITFWDSAPALLEQLAPLLPAQHVESRLRLVFLSGDWVPISMPGRLWQAFGRGCKVVALGGATEATVWSNFHVIDDVPSHWVSIPYGRPISNARYYVLDPQLQPCPVGVPGDLHIAGPCLADGYTDPELTARKFIADPFGQPGTRMYVTGDRARFWADGTMEFLGRIDHQVKLRGFRIELGEVEAAVTSHPDVRSALAIVRKDDGFDRRLVVYVVRQPDREPRPSELRAHAKQRLPEYMLPSAFVVLDALPVTPNGKVDRKALPMPEGAVSTAQLAPRTRAEAVLAELFAAVLRVPTVGILDDFFELGGHSLLAIRLFASIGARLHVKLPMSTLFRAPTVEALARAVDQASTTVASSSVVPLRVGGSRAPAVFIHPGSGTVLGYQALVARLAPDRPCFGIEARGLSDGETPAATVAEMAELYARQLLDARSTGPFHLIGWSFGGVVATELAKLLRTAGHDVASITLIDSFAPSAFRGIELDDDVVALDELATDLGLSVRPDQLRALAPDAAVAHVAELAHQAGLLPVHVGADQLGRRVRVIGANLRAHQRYEPGHVEGRVTLIRASEGTGIDPAAGWRLHLPQGFEVRDVPGNHFTIVKPPHVDELARVLDAVLGDR